LNPATAARWFFPACRAALVAVVVGTTPNAHGADSASCDPPKRDEQPAAGQWTGSYNLTYELLVPQMPPTMKISVAWDGPLNLTLVRPPLREDPPSPPPSRPLSRQPLRPPSAYMPGGPAAPDAVPTDTARPGQFASDDEQRAAVIAEWERHWQEEEGIAAAKAKAFGNAVLRDGQTGVISGTASGNIRMEAGGTFAPGLAGAGSEHSTEPQKYELKASETDPAAGFGEIQIIGEPGAQGFAGSFSAAGAEGRGSVQAQIGPDGSITGRARGESRGHVEEHDVATAGSGAPAAGPTLLAALAIEETKCWLMRGQVDASTIRTMMQQSAPGMDINVTTSEWTATFKGRDEAFERRVQQLVAQPIPPEMTWEVVDRYGEEYKQLHAAATSDYKRCVLVEAQRKGIRLTVAALETLVRNAPRVRDGATGAVLKAWHLRTLPLVRTLQLAGLGDCAVAAEAEEKFYEEMRELLRRLLESGRYTLDDLKQFVVLESAGQMGDLEMGFRGAFNSLLPRGPGA
jgi:hypothetical protein